MKKVIPITIAFVLLILISACVITAPLIIVNSSDEEIELQYESKEFTDFVPEFMSENSFNSWKIFRDDWQKVSPEQFSVDETGRKISLKIKPHQAVILEFQDKFYLREEYSDRFTFKNLKIKGENKEVIFDSSEKLLNEFLKKDFVITYK